jgi:hypothetical protein
MRICGKLLECEELPCGVLQNGVINRSFELKELTGSAISAISDKAVRRNYGKVVDTVLQHCVVNVGGSNASLGLLQDLLVADRDFLVMRARAMSLGKDVRAEIQCPKCEKMLNLQFDISISEIMELEESDFYRKGDLRIFKVVNPVNKKEAEFKYPTGKEQILVSPISAENPIAGNYRLLSECLLKYGDAEGPFGSNFCDDLKLNELNALTDAFLDKMAGPDLELSVTCEYCANVFTGNMERSDFLFPFPTKKKSQKR